ncbi:MAG: group 1 truncated hemoglobin [Burkholderiales bacterium]|jgi:hemoglobin|nr:group 1 truncated hemoglobin [Burkholderiales bacterium]
MKLQSSPLTRNLASVALTCAMALPTLAHAQMASSPTLYEQLGGKPAITMVVHDMLANVVADNRINHDFARTNIPHLQMELVSQICEATGGPCKYTGLNMQQAHKGMNLKTADFNALVEDLQKSMNSNSVPLGLQNQLLAILAPMEPDVVHK